MYGLRDMSSEGASIGLLNSFYDTLIWFLQHGVLQPAEDPPFLFTVISYGRIRMTRGISSITVQCARCTFDVALRSNPDIDRLCTLQSSFHDRLLQHSHFQPQSYLDQAPC